MSDSSHLSKLRSKTPKEGMNMNLIAGYVKKVAILFEIAPSTKAENAESASGDESASNLFCFSLSSRCFS